MSREHAVWRTALKTHIIAQDLPVARLHVQSTANSEETASADSSPPPSHSAIHLERLTCRSLTLHENWLRGRPKRQRLCPTPSGKVLDENLKLVRMRFFSRKGRDFIAVFGHRLTPVGGRIMIWELMQPEPRFAGYWHSNEYNSGFMLNDDLSSEGLFAVSALPAA